MRPHLIQPRWIESLDGLVSTRKFISDVRRYSTSLQFNYHPGKH